LAKCTFRDTYGDDYLLCLQVCLLGPLEYVRTPMIVFYQRIIGSVDNPNPMYSERPITLITLLIWGGPRKCWVVLILGCFYLLKIRGVSFFERVSGIAAHLFSFLPLYRSRLAKETVFQLFAPMAWVSRTCLRVANRSRSGFVLKRKIKNALSRV